MNFFDVARNDTVSNTGNKTSEPSNQHTIYQNVKRGDSIKILRIDGGQFNHYKGYIGEIKEYRRGQTNAFVLLHAVNVPRLLSIPLEHFEVTS
jgi:hypothetical protein